MFSWTCISLTLCLSHGYGRWQDIANDPKFTVINEPFRRGKVELTKLLSRKEKTFFQKDLKTNCILSCIKFHLNIKTSSYPGDLR